jgi:hypothetical protein
MAISVCFAYDRDNFIDSFGKSKFMTIYFSSNKIPALASYSLEQRQQILAIAQSKLSAPEKLILNLIKLTLLIPPFLFVANLQGMALIASLFAIIVAYFVLLRPIMLFFTVRYLTSALKSFTKENDKKSEH